MVDNDKFSEMLKLKGKVKDAEAQKKFNEWYNSLDDSEKKAFDKYDKKWTRIGIVIIAMVILALVGSCFGGGSKGKEEKPQEAQTQQQEQQQDVQTEPALTGEEADKAEITKIVQNSVKSADYRDITITKIADTEKYNVVLFLNGKDNLTTNMIYTGYKNSCKEGFKGLYTSSMGEKINDVKISIYTRMVNTQTGEESEDIIYMLAMTRARANQMHWENIDSVDIEKAATEKFMHPALRKDLKSK
ncbi:hypothetical protein [uncultured Selenomonas sp.]|uniref:hypothetical protein n=1 Tax=uncultured Selenomonas sp. TaxID=159275 RepID=UPI00258A5E9B|nr:hypothetical protein [uncultured Selenomonas sp.]